MKTKKCRGMATDLINEMLKKFKNEKELTFDNTRFLRLMVYVDYCSKNNMSVAGKINDEEKEIFLALGKLGLVQSNIYENVAIEHNFYTFLSELLYQGYVLENEEK